MKTPICDFINEYRNSGIARLHMPGHKGRKHLGFEDFDITEISGADALFEAEGIIGESEANATALFGSGRTLYSTEGSSLCVKTMLYLAAMLQNTGKPPVFVAGRNAHKSFIYGAAVLDAKVEWLYPETAEGLCGCSITPEGLARVLENMQEKAAAVYVTSPDYLGNMLDIKALAEVCHRYGSLLLVDNAHGAYLGFLSQNLHPISLGADMCCDSAHKTLPVLTGGAYLHIAKNAPKELSDNAKAAMELYGSTSPSYLILASLDKCNEYLASGYREKLADVCAELDKTRACIRANGWKLIDSDPLKITVEAPLGMTGHDLGEFMRNAGAEPEYEDRDYLVTMFTPDNSLNEIRLPGKVFGKSKLSYEGKKLLSPVRSERFISLREAVFCLQESIPVREAVGKICASPAVACPPAIPLVVSGETITPEAVEMMLECGIGKINIAK